jgi:hypothetical protein
VPLSLVIKEVIMKRLRDNLIVIKNKSLDN